MGPRFAQCPLTIQLLLQPAQGLFHRLTFFQSDFRQFEFTPLSNASHPSPEAGTKTLRVYATCAHHSRRAAACQMRSQCEWLPPASDATAFEWTNATNGASNCWSGAD